MKNNPRPAARRTALIASVCLAVGCVALPTPVRRLLLSDLRAADAAPAAKDGTAADAFIPDILGGADAPKGKNKTEITSDSLSYDYENRVCTFDGNVHVTDHVQLVEMYAKKMIVTMDKNNDPMIIQATDDVSIVKDDKKATSARAVYDVQSKKITLLGDPVMNQGKNRLSGADSLIFLQESNRFETKGGRPRLEIERKADDNSLMHNLTRPGDATRNVATAPGAVDTQIIQADSIIYDSKAQQVYIAGQVEVEDRDILMSSDAMDVSFDNANRVTRIIARDNVKIIQDKNTATSKKADYDTVSGVAILSGNPVLLQPGVRQEGAERVVYRRETGKISVEGGQPRLTIERN